MIEEIKCENYHTTDGLKFCMSSVCDKKDCIYHLMNSSYEEIERLKQENEELKEVKEQLKKWNDENLKRQDDMQLWIDLAEEQRRKYRSALEYIKEIALTRDMPSCLNIDCNCDICHDEITEYGKRCIQKGMREILTKIEDVFNEV